MTNQRKEPNHAELRRLSLAATPGPWDVEQTSGFGHDDAPYTVVDARTEQIAECWDNTPGDRSPEQNAANAAFIAAANPSTVLALLDENERLRALVKRIDETLRVPAAEYVPAISDVFALIDEAKQAEEAL